MKVTTLNGLNTSRDMIRQFQGYNHELSAQENEFFAMQNMSSDFYPLLSPRKKRGVLASFDKPNGLFAKEKLMWVNGSNLYYNGALIGQVEDSSKQFVSMGAYILIFPDKKRFHTKTLSLESMEASFSTSGNVTYTLAKQDGTPYDKPAISATAPEEPKDGDLWMDTSSSPHVLKQYSAYSAAWVQIITTYIKIGSENIGTLFREGDGVTIQGSEIAELNTDILVQSSTKDSIVVIGLLDETQMQQTPVTISRTVPDMDFVVEANNRCWGCNSAKHEIYACKLGDPLNWHCFAGLSTDSYAVTIGSDGDFTGAISYLDYVLFFKEDKVHIVQGTAPANYHVSEQTLRGVEKGSAKSLVIVDETLLYKSPDGICAYTGGQPAALYRPFGGVRYKSAVAGGVSGKYYVSMQDLQGNVHLFVYDLSRGLWHREDNLAVTDFVRLGQELYYLSPGGTLGTMLGSVGFYDGGNAGTEEGAVSWYVETGDFGMDSPDQKTISRFLLRLQADQGTSITVSMQYDSSGVWKAMRTITFTKKQSFTIPVIPQRCDHMRLRIAGTGACKIFSLSKETEGGSELHGTF